MPTKGTGLRYPGVMVSSSFEDLREHREAMRAAIDANAMKAEMMEQDSARADGDVIDSSLQKVRDSEAYVGLIGHRYGQTPECPDRNPEGLSLTQLELHLARALDKPILLFVMGDNHPITVADVEIDPVKREKLAAFKADAKRMTEDGTVERVYAVFESYEDFHAKAVQAAADLARFLAEPDDGPPPTVVERGTPIAPDLWAVPRYAGSHRFVGRAAELETLDDWADAANPHPVLLFEAIGGTGKSMLTWHWLTTHAPELRADWAGCLWYSFYERGADMTAFLRHALAYTTGRTLSAVENVPRAQLADGVLAAIEVRPWLFVLDGLERVLVAYNRLDAAQVRDEDAGGSDEIADRDVRATARPQDDDLLRRFATAAPSKLLLTTRITPRSLLNPAGLPIQGVRRELLPGLRPGSAEALLRSCGVNGTSEIIQRYLSVHCDCHPLVTGVVAGLVNEYLPARGDFDAWAADPAHGGQLDLAELDLAQKRNHILTSSINSLGPSGRELLSTLALVTAAADYALLQAVNPHGHDVASERELAKDITQLESRGLVQFDRTAGTYDLHPVVRAVAFGALDNAEIDHLGQRVVDHFSSAEHEPYEQATSLNDLTVGIALMQAYLQMGRLREAYSIYSGDLATALWNNVPGAPTMLELLKPFFPDGWDGPCDLPLASHRYLLTDVAAALRKLGLLDEGLALTERAVELALLGDEVPIGIAIYNLSLALIQHDRLADAVRVTEALLVLVPHWPDARFHYAGVMAGLMADLGRVEDATRHARDRRAVPPPRSRSTNRPGDVEMVEANIAFAAGTLDERTLDHIEQVATEGRSFLNLVACVRLRTTLLLAQEQWDRARPELERLTELRRAAGQPTSTAAAQLLVARHHLGLATARHELTPLEGVANPYWTARAALVHGDRATAVRDARTAYTGAWADGEPYVFRHELKRARALLEELGEPVPELASYDPAKHPPYPWEAELRERFGR